MIEIRRNLRDIDWQEAAEVFRRAPLGSRDPERLGQAFENSYAVSFAYANETLVGLARAISDGIAQAAIYDVVVDPPFQGSGVGRLLMEDIHAQLGAIENRILYAAPGMEPFYARFGYRKLKTGMAILSARNSRPGSGYLEDPQAQSVPR